MKTLRFSLAVLYLLLSPTQASAQETKRDTNTVAEAPPAPEESQLLTKTLVDGEEPSISLKGELITVAALNNIQVSVYSAGDAADRFYYVPIPLLDKAQMAKDLSLIPAGNEKLVHSVTIFVDLFNEAVDKEIAAKLSALKTKTISADMVQLVPSNVIEIYADIPLEGTSLLTSSPSREALARGLGSGTNSTVPSRVEAQIVGNKRQLESFMNNPKMFAFAYTKAFKVKQNRVDLGLVSVSSEDFKNKLFGDSNANEKISWYQKSSGRGVSRKPFLGIGSRKSSLSIGSEGSVDYDRKRWVTRDHVANLVMDEFESMDVTIWQEFGVTDENAQQFISSAFEKLFAFATSSQQVVHAEFQKQGDGTYKLISDVAELQGEFKAAEIQVDKSSQLKLQETEKESKTEKDSSESTEEGQEVTLSDGLKAIRNGDYFIPTKVDLYQISEAEMKKKLQMTFRHLKAEPDIFTLKTVPASLNAPVQHTAIEMISQELGSLKEKVAKMESRLNDSIVVLDVRVPNERLKKLGNGESPGTLDVKDAKGNSYRYESWEMLIVGHAFNKMDVSEGSHHKDWKVMPIVQGGVWKIDANVLGHSRDQENWVFRVVLIRRDLFSKNK